MAATFSFRRYYFKILLLALFKSLARVKNSIPRYSHISRYDLQPASSARLIKNAERLYSRSSFRSIAVWHKHGHLSLSRPFKQDLTVFEIERNPGPDNPSPDLHHEVMQGDCAFGQPKYKGCKYSTNMVSQYANPHNHQQFVYSRDQLLYIRSSTYNYSSP